MTEYHKNTHRTHGYVFRRMIHILMGLIPFLYYFHGDKVHEWLPINANQLISLIVICVVVFEAVRLLGHWKVYGQRDYEAYTISAAAWTIFALGLVLLQTPRLGVHGGGLGIPLILAACFSDPMMGEARIRGYKTQSIILVGVVFASLAWLIGVVFLGAPWWLIPILVPITVLAELPCLSWMDDNATMLLLPLAAIFLIIPWTH